MMSATCLCVGTVFAAVLASAVGTDTAGAAGKSYAVLHAFAGKSDGAEPIAGLVADKAGNLYGTTTLGGSASHYRCKHGGCGAAYRLSPQGMEESVYTFFRPWKFGANPSGGLVESGSGNYYGLTAGGGRKGLGAVFVVRFDGKGIHRIHSFGGVDDGAQPYGGLIRDNAGNLYGTTTSGGDADMGTVFKVTANGAETVLHSFSGSPDGYFPHAGLIIDSAGNLYGTTEYGGDGKLCNSNVGCGTVFKVATDGSVSILYSFAGASDGAYPAAGLTMDASGNLFGTTYWGGTSGCYGDYGCGTVFELTPGGSETVLHAFAGGKDGFYPSVGLVEDESGDLFGTTRYGGDLKCGNGAGCGTVFKIEPGGPETILHRFAGGSDGSDPEGALLRNEKGVLFGATVSGGGAGSCSSGGCGTVYKLKP